MHVIKYIAQVLSSLIYTPIYTGLMYIIICFPTMWILELPLWKMILAFIFFGGIVVEGIICLMQTIGLLPFAWIIKSNKTSFVISIILCIIPPILNIISIWMVCVKYGARGFGAATMLSILLLQFIYGSISALIKLKDIEDE